MKNILVFSENPSLDYKLLESSIFSEYTTDKKVYSTTCFEPFEEEYFKPLNIHDFDILKRMYSFDFEFFFDMNLIKQRFKDIPFNNIDEIFILTDLDSEANWRINVILSHFINIEWYKNIKVYIFDFENNNQYYDNQLKYYLYNDIEALENFDGSYHRKNVEYVNEYSNYLKTIFDKTCFEQNILIYDYLLFQQAFNNKSNLISNSLNLKQPILNLTNEDLLFLNLLNEHKKIDIGLFFKLTIFSKRFGINITLDNIFNSLLDYELICDDSDNKYIILTDLGKKFIDLIGEQSYHLHLYHPLKRKFRMDVDWYDINNHLIKVNNDIFE